MSAMWNVSAMSTLACCGIMVRPTDGLNGPVESAVTIGVQACPDRLLTGYDYSTKVCRALLVMDF